MECNIVLFMSFTIKYNHNPVFYGDFSATQLLYKQILNRSWNVGFLPQFHSHTTDPQ